MLGKKLGVALAATMLLAGSQAFAGSATSQFGVSATVVSNCSISSAPIAFGSYDPLNSSIVTAQGSVSVKCSAAAPGVTIALDNGGHSANAPSGSPRAMTNGSSFLGYDIMQPNNTTEWGSGAGQTLAVTADGTTQTFTSNGKVPAQQNVTVGAYSDTVTATVNF